VNYTTIRLAGTVQALGAVQVANARDSLA